MYYTHHTSRHLNRIKKWYLTFLERFKVWLYIENAVYFFVYKTNYWQSCIVVRMRYVTVLLINSKLPDKLKSYRKRSYKFWEIQTQGYHRGDKPIFSTNDSNIIHTLQKIGGVYLCISLYIFVSIYIYHVVVNQSSHPTIQTS